MKYNRRHILGSAVGAGVAVISSGSAVVADQWFSAGNARRAEHTGRPAHDGHAERVRHAGHVVLIGDSIFDNSRYVGNSPAVIDQVRSELPRGWKATLLAVDGSVTLDVARQLRQIPSDATHLIVSVGGNDALGQSAILTKPARSAAEVFVSLAEIQEKFTRAYQSMLRSVLALHKPTAICTVYDPNFRQQAMQKMTAVALSVFNDTILRAAGQYRLPLVDLRLVFNAAADYANPIEPSSLGGAKIARLIHTIVTRHDFSAKQTTIYS